MNDTINQLYTFQGHPKRYLISFYDADGTVKKCYTSYVDFGEKSNEYYIEENTIAGDNLITIQDNFLPI